MLPTPECPRDNYCSPEALSSLVSYGENIHEPSDIETRSTGQALELIRDGVWRGRVEQIRELPPHSPAQKKAKAELPYFTWSGEFRHRDSKHLVRHAGQVGIDLDDLSHDASRSVLHKAVDDPHCLAAFRSVSGAGMRLLIRVPPITANLHPTVYREAARYVRKLYHVEPDTACSDVARPSFVSWDGEMWINPNATPLVVQAAKRGGSVHSDIRSLCTPAIPAWVWIAREVMPFRKKPDGTAYTHGTLLELGKRLVLRSAREGYWMAEAQIESAAEIWMDEAVRQGYRLHRPISEYQTELIRIVAGARKCDWVQAAAEKWTRWIKLKEFPRTSKERLIFAIRRHCEDSANIQFFLSVRDAAAVADVCPARASQLLRELVAEGVLERVNESKRPARHAASYRLLHTEGSA